MPKRIELRELGTLEIGGVPVAVAHAQGRRAVLYVAAYDADGFLETADDVKRAAAKYRTRLDKSKGEAHDY